MGSSHFRQIDPMSKTGNNPTNSSGPVPVSLEFLDKLEEDP